MTPLIDKSVIFMTLFFIYYLAMGSTIGIVPVLMVISFACLLTYVNQQNIKLGITLSYLVICFFIPELIIFLPIICYDILFTPYQFFCFASILPMLYSTSLGSYFYLLTSVVFFFVTYFVKHKSQIRENLKKEFITYRDQARETSLNLEAKNKELLEKQDYEIHIATLKERNRISMEIHDNVGHLLSSSLLQLAAILAVNQDSSIQENLQTVTNTLSSAMDSIRNSVHQLHKETLDLNTQVTSIVESFHFCPIQLDNTIATSPSANISYAMLAIIKEALSNIMKHSNATKVEITMREHPKFYQLRIQDNGICNFNRIPNGIGLKNMEQRVEALHGNIHLDTENGFRIFISLPKENL